MGSHYQHYIAIKGSCKCVKKNFTVSLDYSFIKVKFKTFKIKDKLINFKVSLGYRPIKEMYKKFKNRTKD